MRSCGTAIFGRGGDEDGEQAEARAVVAEQTEFGLGELDPNDMRLVGLEYWHASQALFCRLSQDAAVAARQGFAQGLAEWYGPPRTYDEARS
jgi:hypothetical protein